MTQHYPTSIEEAFPAAEKIKAARARLEEAGVQFVFSCWIDILGSPKTKPVPLSEFENLCLGKGPQFAVHSVSMFPELGPTDPDQIPVPDLRSLVICPWDTTLAFVFADLFYKGEPYNMCPRMALRRQVAEAAGLGYAFYAGLEPEFIVMTYDEDGDPAKAIEDAPDNARRLDRQPFGYDSEYTLSSMGFLGEVTRYLNDLGWGVKNLVCEGGYSQFELDFGYTDVLGIADRMTFLRVLLKEVAKRHGMFVTYMPKPSNGDWRSGAHINHSVQAVDRPDNLFSDDGSWSELARNAVAGLIRHGAALTAVTCPTVNSYKGLVGRDTSLQGGTLTWAPTHMTYGTNNRSAMIRLPQARHAIENRAADMSQNFYLGLAMTVGASLAGMKEKLDPGPPFNKPLYDATPEELKAAGAKRLPATLHEAIAAFDEDEVALDVFGPVMHRQYSRHKHAEWNEYHDHVSEWEVRRYLRFF